MLMSRVSLLAPPTTVRPTAAAVVDLLWLHARVGDGVSHIHVRAAPHGFDVVAFTVAPDQPSADRVARRMCEHALRSVPALSGWVTE